MKKPEAEKSNTTVPLIRMKPKTEVFFKLLSILLSLWNTCNSILDQLRQTFHLYSATQGGGIITTTSLVEVIQAILAWPSNI
jgi:hypothetical protein